jgi:adenylate cyclase
LKQHLARYLLGSLLLLILLAHSAADSLLGYQIDIISRLDAIIYDTKLRLTMPRSVDTRVVIVDVDEKSLADGDGTRCPCS